MKKYIVEFIGTFFFILTIGCTVIGSPIGALAPLAIGSVLMVMVYAGGHISGGHFNPAVTLGVWLRGKCDSKDVAPYMISQFTLSQLPSMLIARAATVTIVTNEIVLSSIINNLARDVSGKSSVALNAVAVPNARNR
jgi:aquaporin Z